MFNTLLNIYYYLLCVTFLLLYIKGIVFILFTQEGTDW